MQYRDLLEPGKAVLLMLTAEEQGDDVRARIQTVEPLDAAAEKMQKGLRYSSTRISRSKAWPSGSNGTRRACAIRERQGRCRGHDGADARQGAEVEVKLPGRYKVSPQIAGAIKAVPGVMQVEAM